ncbi:hypothetical protein RB595_005417 [Gaeumannomyces hyphopodioides]
MTIAAISSTGNPKMHATSFLLVLFGATACVAAGNFNLVCEAPATLHGCSRACGRCEAEGKPDCSLPVYYDECRCKTLPPPTYAADPNNPNRKTPPPPYENEQTPPPAPTPKAASGGKKPKRDVHARAFRA